MLVSPEGVIHSSSDLTRAANCEYSVLRELDRKLGRVAQADRAADAMMARTAELGAAHEERLLARYLAEVGPWDEATGRGVYVVERPSGSSYLRALPAKHTETVDALRAGADVVVQGGFFDGSFHGWADFIVRQPDGSYLVQDTKLARTARTTAVLQLAAYADQLERAGVAVHPRAQLVLGDDSVSEHSLTDVIPLYLHRRARLEAVLAAHLAGDAPAEWDDGVHSACGRCDDCAEEVAARRDVLLVAGLSVVQRDRLRDAGITTIEQLAASQGTVARIGGRTLDRLRAQARLQVMQPIAEDGAAPAVSYEVFDAGSLAHLPVPDGADMFFDFEGDPLWNDGNPRDWGLEYLFGWVDVASGAATPRFTALWAHTRQEEKAALEEFIDHVTARRAANPGMHVYHYAAYEQTALKRLVGRHGTREEELDELLRAGVLVDLYPVVRGSVRVSQPSYSIKKLEPLYMGDELRTGLDNAADSITEYARACADRDAGATQAADALLDDIAQYNEYDCVSTLRLRDWLVDRAAEHGVSPAGVRRAERSEKPKTERQRANQERQKAAAAEADASVRTLLEYAATAPDADAVAARLLAAAVDYHRREDKPYWWAHFHRLSNPDEEWPDSRSCFRVDGTAEETSGWARENGRQAWRRTLRMRGALEPGSEIRVGATVLPYYRDTLPSVAQQPEGCPNGWNPCGATVLEVGVEGDLDVLVISESAGRTTEPPDDFHHLPFALGPGEPVRAGTLVEAIRGVAAGAAARLPVLPTAAVVDILRRVPPRLRDGRTLNDLELDRDQPIDAIITALDAMADSYLAVQGPPGTGKTYTATHVIARLIERGWRIGVVAQSHAVVENVLHGVLTRGVAPERVGKKRKDDGPDAPPVPWTEVESAALAAFGSDDAGGYVIGGTAWDFVGDRVPDPRYDLLVIDEAGQFSLANTIAVSASADRLLLLGDPQQLPQVSQGNHPEPVDHAALGWLTGGARTLPDDLGLFLARTRRLHPELCAPVSRLSYEGRLTSVDVAARRRLEGVSPGLHTVAVSHQGNKTTSQDEADQVAGLLRNLVGRRWVDEEARADRPLDPSDVIVVAAYNAQVWTTRAALDRAGFAATRVGTVDKFQGQEAPVAIVTLAASSPAEVPRGMEFLTDRNRLNVAVSRGQHSAYVVHSPRLLDHLPGTPHALEEFGAFVGLLTPPHPPTPRSTP
ncbi:TM0106 family RecB-like putative nuclease [Cellulomonas bogoriensis]|uniref:DNA helicase n=1 Tax=Cellulomonas bogoriensis 69B4 = DSM 16987 TaxID=1386082 RepID=A0A0A0C2M0_9CELL|nr:bifunctional RecB family nuclease/DEAD/DEAH box helicase [Cellulomonas bogoriensis]KGM14435.1 DNA helicase [Cellulomonas bogoriensis 69B4 = DSM 16987]